MRTISSSLRDIRHKEFRSLFKDNVKIQIVSSVDVLEKVVCDKESVIVVDLKLYEEILKKYPDILKGCNVVINEG